MRHYMKFENINYKHNIPKDIFDKHFDEFSKKYPGYLEDQNGNRDSMTAVWAFEILWNRNTTRQDFYDYLGTSRSIPEKKNKKDDKKKKKIIDAMNFE
jgi:hypothetical protein